MELIRLLHLVLLATWGGLVLAEIVVEVLGQSQAGQAFALRAHFWMDVLIEIPLVGGVLATGAILTARAWPLSTLHLVKIGAALVAIAANLVCAALVFARYRHRNDPARVAALARYVRATGIAVPAGLVAAYIGFVYFL